MNVQGIDPRMIADAIRDNVSTKGPAAPTAPEGPGFGEVLSDAIARARTEESTANDLSTRFAAGDASVGMHEVMIAAERSSIAVRYAVTVKNKAIEAYRELMNTPV